MTLKRFYQHTFIYTLGNLMYRGAAFFLVPLYAHALKPAEYGSLELITLTAFVVQSVFSAGVASSALRYYFEFDSDQDRHTVISSALIGSFVFAGLGGLALFMLAPSVSTLVFATPGYSLAFRLAAITLVIDISREINFAYLRATERSRFFIVVALVQLLTQVAATFYCVVGLKLGIVGVLIGNFTASASIWIILTTFTVAQCGLRFEWRKLRPLAAYGLPLTVAGLIGAAFQTSDRWVLTSYTTLQAIGVYALAVRVVNVIPTLVVTPFNNSYGPFRFSIMKQDDARQTYARVLTYYLMAASFIALGIVSITEDVLHLAAAPEYWPAIGVVPLMIIAPTLSGADYCFQTGIHISKKTKYLSAASMITGFVNLALVWLLVPRYGIYGAALAGVGSALYGVTQTCIIAQRLYRIPYEFSRGLRVFGAAVALALVTINIHANGAWMPVAMKLLIVASFPVVLAVFGVYTANEVKLARVWLAWLRTASPFGAGTADVKTIS